MAEIKSKLSNFVINAINEDLDRILQNVNQKGLISFAGGLPDPSVFPIEELKIITAGILEKYGANALQYGSTYGVPELINGIKGFMKDKLKVKVKEDDKVLITNGSQEGLFSVTSTFINPGEYVITENPTYFVAVSVFKAINARVTGVPITPKGIDTYKLEERVRKLANEGEKVKLIYVMPNCHNPTGISMSDETKKHLLEIASKYDLLVLEDDPYSLINYEGNDPIPLKAYDKDDRVIYMSTFSKILSPGLRLGWLFGNSEIIDKIMTSKQIVSLNTSNLVQYIAFEALSKGIVENTIRRVTNVYRRKRDVMKEAFKEYLGSLVNFENPQSGMFFFVKFNNVNTRKLLEGAIKAGVMYLPGDITYVEAPDYTTARFNFTYPNEEKIVEGIRRLSDAIKEYKSL